MYVPFLSTTSWLYRMKHIVIIGNGIAGVTTARHIRKRSTHRITIISSETPYFFSRTALMYVYMGHMTFEHTKPYPDDFWEKNGIELKHAYVTSIQPENKQVLIEGGEQVAYDSLVLAVGSKPRTFNWPGEDLQGVQGLYSFQDLQLLEKHAPNAQACKRAVIVGGGLIGVELAEMLHSRNIPVTFLVRESSFWNGVLPEGDSALITDHIKKQGLDLRLNTNLKAINDDGSGKVKSVTIAETGKEIPCDFVGLTTGVQPNIDFLRSSPLEVDTGILVNEYLETNLPDVYAIGDCTQLRNPLPHRRSIEAVWYVGRMMGETLAQTLTGTKTAYSPGHWFNSAKFFHIEYQTYGQVHPTQKKQANEKHFHWKHPNKDKAMTFAYELESHRFLGINTLGIRLRHEVMNQWLSKEKSIHDVISHLQKAHFDPEFYQRHYKTIQQAFESQKSTLTL